MKNSNNQQISQTNQDDDTVPQEPLKRPIVYSKRDTNPYHIIYGGRLKYLVNLLTTWPFSLHKKHARLSSNHIEQQLDHLQNNTIPKPTANKNSKFNKYLPNARVIASLLAVTLILIVATCLLMYTPKSTPSSVHNSIFGVSVENLSEPEAIEKLNNISLNQQITIDINGANYQFVAKDLGIARDIPEIVESNYQKSQSQIDKLIAKKQSYILAKTYVNQAKLVSAIESRIGQYKVSEDASITVNGEDITVNPAKTGIKINFDNITKQIESIPLNEPVTIKADLTKTEPVISTDAANRAKEKADAIMNQAYGTGSQAYGFKYATKAQKASWLTFTKNTTAKEIDVDLNINSAKSTLTKLSNSFVRASKEKTVLATDGYPNSVLEQGQSGISVDQASLDAGLAALENAINNKQAYTIALTLNEQPASERNLGSINSGKFILVDVPKFKAYAIDGSTAVRTMFVSTGVDKMPTPAGHFKILSKMPLKTMTGCNLAAGCWNVPNVPNVQFFTSEGHAFHGTYWHNDFGKVNRSHGCVNLTQNDATWLYGWTEVGTDVVIVR